MAKNIFKGMGIALVTPFTQEGTIDYPALERLLEFQLANGADFLCILGTTAETPCLTGEEKMAVKKFVAGRINGRVPLLMGCGGNNTAAIVAELQSSDLQGVDGILSVCPYYNKPTQDGLYEHFRTVAAASRVPVVLYNVPGRTGVNLRAATVQRLAADCPNIVAVKEASGRLEQAIEVIIHAPEGFDVLCGDDSLALPMLASGAVGAISVIGNAMPFEFSQLINAALKGNVATARTLHRQLAEVFTLLFADGNPAGIKALLSEMGLIKNVLRLPLVPARESTVERLRDFARLSSSLL